MEIKFAPSFFEDLKYMLSPMHKIETFFCNIKYFFQKVFRKHHTSDLELWNLYSHIAKIILPKLKTFRKMKKNGYPAIFSEYEDDNWESKNKYDEYIASGKLIGGGLKKWNEILDEMIFAFEYILYKDSDDHNTEYLKKKYGDWTEKKPENLKKLKCLNYEYYYDEKLDAKLQKRCDEGLILFAKHFQSMWD